ncbi:hypothetical protein HRI_003149100 [Hibiscus trionum]|uniref:Uncharacterized protein n=1 Tax=Hibiscus trionum TaxID=183268 RepID=A0A9W7IG81_HIBTR|nr:hypothetical protein HRI_003149100 [Hibiscus trionum]
MAIAVKSRINQKKKEPVLSRTFSAVTANLAFRLTKHFYALFVSRESPLSPLVSQNEDSLALYSKPFPLFGFGFLRTLDCSPLHQGGESLPLRVSTFML